MIPENNGMYMPVAPAYNGYGNDMSGHYPPDYPMYPENRRW